MNICKANNLFPVNLQHCQLLLTVIIYKKLSYYWIDLIIELNIIFIVFSNHYENIKKLKIIDLFPL